MERDASERGYRQAADPRWPDHKGRPVPDAAYPVRPDPIIGDVVSAWSNQTTHGPRPMPAKQRRLIALGLLLIAGLIGFFGGMGTLWLLAQLDVRPEPAIVYVAIGLVSLGVLYVLSRPRPCASYIGSEGVHEHVEMGIRRHDAAMRFRDADTLCVRERDETTGSSGGYQGTSYTLTFRDASDRSLLEISGLRYDRGMWAQESEHWVFAQAVITRWTAIRWERAKEEKQKHGTASFRAGKKTLRVGEGRVLIDDEVLERAAIDRITVVDGFLAIHRVGAKEGIFRSTGIDRFEIGEIGDFEVLLRALRTWGGFAVET